MTPDLGPILDDLAAGRISAEEANRRIEELDPAEAEAHGEAAVVEEPAAEVEVEEVHVVDAVKQDRDERAGGGLKRVAITSVGRRVRLEGDASISTLKVEGSHMLRRNGEVMEVTTSGKVGPSFKDMSIFRPQQALEELRRFGIGKELVIKVNPKLIVDVEVTTGGLRSEGVPRLGRVRVTGGSCNVYDVEEVSDLLMQAGGVLVQGPIRRGRSKVSVETGALTLELAREANVTVHGQTRMGRIVWPEESDGVDQFVVGNGSARLDISVVGGQGQVKVEDQ